MKQAALRGRDGRDRECHEVGNLARSPARSLYAFPGFPAGLTTAPGQAGRTKPLRADVERSCGLVKLAVARLHVFRVPCVAGSRAAAQLVRDRLSAGELAASGRRRVNPRRDLRAARGPVASNARNIPR